MTKKRENLDQDAVLTDGNAATIVEVPELISDEDAQKVVDEKIFLASIDLRASHLFDQMTEQRRQKMKEAGPNTVDSFVHIFETPFEIDDAEQNETSRLIEIEKAALDEVTERLESVGFKVVRDDSEVHDPLHRDEDKHKKVLISIFYVSPRSTPFTRLLDSMLETNQKHP